MQFDIVDLLAIYVGAVERTDVAHEIFGASPVDLGVAARHRDIVEKDIATRITSGGDHRAVERIPRATLGPARDDQQTGPGWKLRAVDGDLLGHRVDDVEVQRFGL